MKFDDFLAQSHVYPIPWAWAIKFSIPENNNFSTIWRHTIRSTKAEVLVELRRIRAQGWLRDDGVMEVVRVQFTIDELV